MSPWSSSRALRCAASIATSDQSSESCRSSSATASSCCEISPSRRSSSDGRVGPRPLRLRLLLRCAARAPPAPRRLRAPLRVVGPAALVGVHRLLLDRQRPLGDRVEQRAVVGDEQHRAREGVERGLERLAALEVEVVRRLVEHEEVRARGDDEREREPSPLAAGERGDRLLVRLPAGEEEAAEQRLGLRPRQPRRALGAIEHAAALVELDLVLREVGGHRRRGRAEPSPRAARACRGSSRAASSCLSRWARRARRARRARSRRSHPSGAPCRLRSRRAWSPRAPSGRFGRA